MKSDPRLSEPSLATLRAAAEQHAGRRDWTSAIACFEAIVQRQPSDADALLQLSYVESLAGHYRRARGFALAAGKQRPRDPGVLKELISRLRTFNEVGAVNEVIANLPPISQLQIPLLIDLGAQLSYFNQQQRALMFLDEAKRADPEFPPTLLARAQVLTYLGRFKDAEDDLQRCIRRAPQIPKLYWLLSRLRTQTPDSNHVPQIRQQAARPGHKPEETALLGYALHKELDDLGDYDGAWRAMEAACKAKRSALNYRAEDSRTLVSALMQLPRSRPVPVVDGGSRTPIFIVGMHRSGTTLLEQMLDGHSEVQGVGELYDFTCQMRYATDYHCRGVIDTALVERAHGVDLAGVGARYLAGMEWRLGKPRHFTDKLPSNFLNLGFICQALPQAKILHMVRDPVETCFSNLRELFGEANPYSYDQIELADYHRQYRRLMAHWHALFPGRILDVDYAALTGEPEAALRRVVDFCGLGFEPGMLDLKARSRGVATASAVQVRDKVVALETPKWEPYRRYLGPLMSHLAG